MFVVSTCKRTRNRRENDRLCDPETRKQQQNNSERVSCRLSSALAFSNKADFPTLDRPLCHSPSRLNQKQIDACHVVMMMKCCCVFLPCLSFGYLYRP
ncbi:hypothetical protein K456DRAFT_636529 [Colletotrichum gloeosporioides 23]|nr:hypothetical protein K456DRAFT_636529 [Colletotrichum gloeosporioides 23]